MKKRKSYLLSAFLVFAFCNSPILFATDYPKPQGYITDAAGILDIGTRQALESRLTAFERATSNEIAIATVASLKGESIEFYAEQLFKRWGVGKKGKDNGILILVAPNEREMRIEVGYGLESKLTDGMCGEIIRNQMVPSFKQSQYGKGLLAAVDAVQNRLEGKTFEMPVTPYDANRTIPSISQIAVPLAGLFVVLPLTVIGIIFAWVLLAYADGPISFFGLIAIGVGLIFDILRLSGRSGRSGSGSGGYWGGGGGFSGGFGGGGGFSGGGGGFGGFGGGSSGGGGASGRW